MMKYLRSIIASTLFCLMLLSALNVRIAAQAVEPIYDIVIRNGRVLDGAGNPWTLVDVAIKDGKFAKIGKIAGKGTRDFDGLRRIAAPDGSPR